MIDHPCAIRYATWQYFWEQEAHQARRLCRGRCPRWRTGAHPTVTPPKLGRHITPQQDTRAHQHRDMQAQEGTTPRAARQVMGLLTYATVDQAGVGVTSTWTKYDRHVFESSAYWLQVSVPLYKSCSAHHPVSTSCLSPLPRRPAGTAAECQV